MASGQPAARQSAAMRMPVSALVLLVACGAPARPTGGEPPAALALYPRQAELWSLAIDLHGQLSPTSGSATALVHCELEREDSQPPGGPRAHYEASLQSNTFFLRLPVPPGQHSTVYASCRDDQGHTHRAPPAHVVSMVSARDADLLAHAGSAATSHADSAWIDEAIVYGLIPPLYGQPPLAKVTAALDAMHELGVNTLWLSPIFATTPGDFGYAVTDSFHVRGDYGTDDALDTLLHSAHARGMRVLLDLVINHSSDEHRYFREAEALGPRSHYFAFYDRDRSGQPTHYFDWQHLPNFNYGDPEVVWWAMSFSKHWIERGADGYRVDAAWGVKQRAPSFFPRWSALLHAVKPALLLLAEASARDPYYLESGFDAAYDWTDELGHHAWEGVFSSSQGIAARLAAAVEETARRAQRPERTFRFLNNNDTGARFISRHGAGLTRVATAALLTLPGIPCVYALDELGAEYAPYEEEQPRVPANPSWKALHQALIALRKSTPALRGAGYRALKVGTDDELFVFLRTASPLGSPTQGARASTSDEPALVALNFADRPVRHAVALPPEFSIRPAKRLHDALAGSTVVVTPAGVDLQLEPWGAKVLLPLR
jgi:cyclomaltodextrinase